MEPGCVRAKSCGRCMCGSGTLLTAINKRCNVIEVQYTWVYKLTGMSRFAIECVQVNRTGVNAYSIGIKL